MLVRRTTAIKKRKKKTSLRLRNRKKTSFYCYSLALQLDAVQVHGDAGAANRHHQRVPLAVQQPRVAGRDHAALSVQPRQLEDDAVPHETNAEEQRPTILKRRRMKMRKRRRGML